MHYLEIKGNALLVYEAIDSRIKLPNPTNMKNKNKITAKAPTLPEINHNWHVLAAILAAIMETVIISLSNLVSTNPLIKKHRS